MPKKRGRRSIEAWIVRKRKTFKNELRRASANNPATDSQEDGGIDGGRRSLQATLRELQGRVGNLATTNVQLQNSLQAEQQSRAQAEARFTQEIQGAQQQAAHAHAAATAAGAARPGEPRQRDEDFGGGIRAILKWVPDPFTGKREDWPSWSVKFRAFVGAVSNG